MTPGRREDAPYLAVAADFPDPAVLEDGGTYVAYATNSGGRNVQVATADDVHGPWSVHDADALPELGAWASTGFTWAPDVARLADGSFLMYYTARDTASRRQLVGAATASGPLGLFRPVGDGPLVGTAVEGGAIDAAHFVDADGTRYVVYKNDGNAVGVPTYLYVQEVAADGVTLVGDRVATIRNDDAEGDLVEAPFLVRGDGGYVLFYSYGRYDDETYTESFARAPSLAGPWTKAARPLMSTAGFAGRIAGPGGASVLREPGGDHIVFHGVVRTPAYHRAMYVADLDWAGGDPVVRTARRPGEWAHE